jgi:two-component system cell cycle response regulator
VVLEDQAFAMNHRELGAAMLADWGVPDALVQPVRFHEQPELAGYAEDSRERRARAVPGAGACGGAVVPRARAEHVRLMAPMLRLSSRLGLSRGEFVSLCERVGRDWGEWGKLLQIRTEDAPSFVEVSAQGRRGRARASASCARRRPAMREPAADAGAGRDGQARRPCACCARALEAAGRRRVRGRRGGTDAALEMAHRRAAAAAAGGLVGRRRTRGARCATCASAAGVYVITLLTGERMPCCWPWPRPAPTTSSSAGAARRADAAPACLPAHAGAAGELEHEREELRNFAAELSISNRRLQEAALTDPLTGLPNRRQAIESMQAEWATATRHTARSR